MNAHSIFPPSASKRWLNCPGSVKLSQSCPPQTESEAAKEGTLAHQISELCLTKGGSAKEHGAKGELAKHVDNYVEFVNSLAASVENAEVMVEKRLVMPFDERLFGTSDAVIFGQYSPSFSTKTLDIIDFKYGKWPVPAKDNPQLMFYALAASYLIPETERHDLSIIVHIFQPRIKSLDQRVQSSALTMDQLNWFERAIKEAVKNADSENPTLNDGEHCRFCPAEFVCPQLNKIGRYIF